MRAIIRTLLLLLGACLCLSRVSAQPQAALDLVVSPAFEGNYVPGTWLPIRVSITNNGQPISVRVSAELPSETVRYAQDHQLAGGETQQIVLYVPMMQTAREIHLTVAEGDTLLAERAIGVRPRADERILGIVAGAELRLSLPRREDMTRLPFNAVRIGAAELPDRAEGLESLGLLLIQDLPPETLTPRQIGALRSWVAMGGHLILGGGPEAQPASAWLPEDLQAAATGAAQPIDDAPLAALAEAPGPGRLRGVRLTPLPGGVSSGPAEAPAWVARPIGKGKVTQLAFAPDLPGLRDWPAAPTFWDRFLQPALLVSGGLGLQTNVNGLQEEALSSALTAVPTISQPPVDLFFLILVIYTLLIGPVLALFLRRIDRQAWSWLMVPTLAIGSGALLLTLAISLRADSRVITQVSLVEYLGAGQARARTLVGILAPQKQTLTASVPAETLVRPVPLIDGLYGSVGGISGPILQESEQLGVSVDAWQMQGFVAEGQVALEGLSAEMVLDQQGLLAKVRNQTTQRLLDVVAIYGEQVVRLGDVRPGAEASGRWPPTLAQAPPGATISTIIFSDVIAEARIPGRATERRTQARMALINAAMISGVSSTDPGPTMLAWLETAPLDVGFETQGAARQSLTLLVIHPHVSGSGIVALPRDWLRVDPALTQRNVCFDAQGAGIAASPSPVTLALRVPDDLTALKASAITLNIDSADKWPSAGVVTELYDWSRGEWVAQQFDGPGDLKIAQPERYLFQGQLQLRLSGNIERATCIYIHSQLQGSLP